MKKFEFNKSMIGKSVLIPNGNLITNPNRIRRKFNDEKVDLLVKTFRGSPVFPEEFPDVIVPVFTSKGEPDIIDGKFVVGIHNTITLSFQKARRDPRDEIRVRFVEYKDWDEVLLQSWKENHNREDVSILDDARYFQKLKQKLVSNEAVAAYIGRDEKHVQRALAIANLPDEIKNKISPEGKEGLAKEYGEILYILRNKPSIQLKFANFIEEFSPSFKEAKDYAHSLKEAKEGTEISLLEQFKKKQNAKQNLRSIEESLKNKGGKPKKEKKVSLQKDANEFVHYVTEVGADMQTLLKDLNELHNIVGESDLEEFLPLIGKGDRQKAKDAIKAIKFCKKKLEDYFEQDKITKKMEEIL